ncbi:MAG: hypothetical protein IKV54_05485 [Clostridia bacterium]|nr:hypothetical protein [Clostridia bacterium]
MASYAYRETHPAYVNIALKGKYMNDPQSRKMVDLVVSGFKLDSAWIYCEKVGSLGGTFRDKIRANSTSYATEFTKQSKRISINLKILGNEFTPD